MSKSPALPAFLENLPSSTFKLLPGEELPGVLRYSPRTVITSQSPLRSRVDSLERLKHYIRSLENMARAYLVTLPLRSTNAKSMDGMMEDFKALQKKIILTKLLLRRAQETYKKREMYHLRYLSQGDIERLVSRQNPFKNTAPIRARL